MRFMLPSLFRSFPASVFASGLFVLLSCPVVQAADPPKRPPVSYVKDVDPFFHSKCITCHSGSQPKGGLSLETPETLMKGGNKGAPVVAKKPDESLLWLYLTAARQPKMPPNEKIDDSQTAMIRRWIVEGAQFDVPKKGEKQPTKG